MRNEKLKKNGRAERPQSVISEIALHAEREFGQRNEIEMSQICAAAAVVFQSSVIAQSQLAFLVLASWRANGFQQHRRFVCE